MGTPYTFDEGMSCHSTRIEWLCFDDNFRRYSLWVRPFKHVIVSSHIDVLIAHAVYHSKFKQSYLYILWLLIFLISQGKKLNNSLLHLSIKV